MTSGTMIGRRSLLVGGLIGSQLAAPAILRAALPDDPLATTANGRVRGVRVDGVSIFRGIPYGGTVSGPDRRFKAPPPPSSWTGIRDASRLGPPSIQPPNQTSGVDEPPMAEDCLVLNVWTPAADGGKRPVMFYSHGGGFTTGSGGARGQDGANLAREQNVVVVETNHRLGVMGYLYLGQLLGPEYQGNQGLQDLVAGLQWTFTNIAAFGGDPHNVMIWGESGGGGKTTCLYGMQSAARFFNKASIESAAGPGNTPPERATEIAREAMKRLGFTDPRQLLSVPAAELIKAQMGSGPNLGPGTIPPPGLPAGQRGLNFSPFIDGKILAEQPFAAAAPAVSRTKPLIVGGCRDETVFFNRLDPTVFKLDDAGLKARLLPTIGDRTDAWIDTFRKSRPSASPSQLFIAITTAWQWRSHAVQLAERKAAQGGAPVYSYILDYRSPVVVPNTDFAQGSPHASDIAMKFDNVALRGEQSEGRRATARAMSEMWATFARTGRPAAKGQPAWPAYTLARRETMMIDARCRVEADPEGAERVFWEGEKPIPPFG